MTGAGPAVAGNNTQSYYDLHYAYEVASHCGLVSAEVEAAFRVGRMRLAAGAGVDAAAIKALRISAIVAAGREYQNRGLGGYRAWCAGEGRDAARRIVDPAAPR